MNVVGFRRVYYENWSSQAQAKMPWVPALSRQPRSSHTVARCSVTRFLGGSEIKYSAVARCRIDASGSAVDARMPGTKSRRMTSERDGGL